MAPVPPRTGFDLAAGAEKRQINYRGLLSHFDAQMELRWSHGVNWVALEDETQTALYLAITK